MGTMPTVRRDSSECDDDSVVTALGGGNVSRRGSTAAVKGKGLSTTGPPLARRPLRLGLALSKSGTSDSETTVTVGGGGLTLPVSSGDESRVLALPFYQGCVSLHHPGQSVQARPPDV